MYKYEPKKPDNYDETVLKKKTYSVQDALFYVDIWHVVYLSHLVN